MKSNESARAKCPVTAYHRAEAGYVDLVDEWLANPHAYFQAFGPEAREFQWRHRSERLRTMTLVAAAEELVEKRPVCLCVDGASEQVESWEQLFAVAASRLIAANPLVFVALQRDGCLEWMGCPPAGTPIAECLEANALTPTFESRVAIVARVQWLFLMCGIRLNEVIVQVDPYSDGEWKVRKAELDRKRAEEKVFMAGRREAQRAWAEAHPEAAAPAPRPHHFL